MEISIISMVFTAVLVLVCLFLVLAPFFNWDGYLSTANGKQESISDKEALLTTLNEIEFEYKMGKLSEIDFKNLKKQYETEISKILKSEDRNVKTKINSSIMSEVEREIEEALKRKRGNKEGKK